MCHRISDMKYDQSEGLGTDYCSSWAHELPGVCSQMMDFRRRQRRRRQQRQFGCRVDLSPWNRYSRSYGSCLCLLDFVWTIFSTCYYIMVCLGG